MTRILVGLLLFPFTALGDDVATPPVAAPPPQVVSVEVTVLQLAGHNEIADATDVSSGKLQQTIDESRSSGKLENLTRVRLSTIAGQESSVQIGAQEAVISGWTMTVKGKTPNYIYQQSGTTLAVTAQPIGEGKIAVSLNLQQSRVEDDDDEDRDADDDAAEIPLSRIRQFHHSTTCMIPDGDTIVVFGSEQSDADDAPLETIVLVHAATVD